MERGKKSMREDYIAILEYFMVFGIGSAFDYMLMKLLD